MSNQNRDTPSDAFGEAPDVELPENRPTVASVSAVASTTDDVENANPSHPDRPVGVNVDTAGIGTGAGATEDAPPPEDDPDDPEEGIGAGTDAADSRDS